METRVQRIGEIAKLFFRLGLTAFGGPAAHLAMMHDEVVTRRKWMGDEDFLELMSAANLIPGPNSTEVAIHVGYRRGGVWGLIVAGASFILPAFALCIGIAALYVRYGQFRITEEILYGVKPVVIAIVVQALWKLGRASVKSWAAAILGVAALALLFLRVDELVVLFGSGVLFLAMKGIRLPRGQMNVIPIAKTLPALAGAVSGAGLMPLFLVFLKMGSVLFGSGYVLLAFLQSDIVEKLHWLTQRQVLDAVAVGQVTPGPVFTTATFVGYIVPGANGQPLGVWGAVAATVGIFLPAFVFVALTAPMMPRLKKAAWAQAFLVGLNVASLALMAHVTWQLGAAALVDGWTVGIALVAAVLLLWRKNLNSIWLIAGGALVGTLHAYLF